MASISAACLTWSREASQQPGPALVDLIETAVASKPVIIARRPMPSLTNKFLPAESAIVADSIMVACIFFQPSHFWRNENKKGTFSSVPCQSLIVQD